MEQTEYAKKKYQQMVKDASPNSKILTNCVKAFLVGGLICALGQVLMNYLLAAGVTQENAKLLVPVILVGFSVLLTGIGWYDKIGEQAGAGSVIPITGFANAIAAPAIEYKKEGLVLGVGAKMFAIAGPVIVYGTMTSVVVGIIYYYFGR